MMLRAVRADFALLAQYRYEPERLPLPVPITVLAGRQAGRDRAPRKPGPLAGMHPAAMPQA